MSPVSGASFSGRQKRTQMFGQASDEVTELSPNLFKKPRVGPLVDSIMDLIDETCEFFLYNWFVNYGCRMPTDEELNSHAILTRKPKEAIRRWFESIMTPQRVAIGFQNWGAKNKNHTALGSTAHPTPPIGNPYCVVGPAKHDESAHVPVIELTKDNKSLQNNKHLLRGYLPGNLEVVIKKVIKQRKQGCRAIRGHETTKKGKFYCTSGCGRRFLRRHEWLRHLEAIYPQEFWFCRQCGDPSRARSEFLFTRKDKFRDHVRSKHEKWREGDALRICSVDFTAPFKRRCGFCVRNEFRATSWNQWIEHVGKHFACEGLTYDKWRDWPENDGGDDDEDYWNQGVAEDDDDDDNDDDENNNDSQDNDDHDNNEKDWGAREGPPSDPHWPTGPSAGSSFLFTGGDDTSFQPFEFSSKWRYQQPVGVRHDSTQHFQHSRQDPVEISGDNSKYQTRLGRYISQQRGLSVFDVERMNVVAVPHGTRYFALAYRDFNTNAIPPSLHRRLGSLSGAFHSDILNARDLLRRLGERYLWVGGLISHSNRDKNTTQLLREQSYSLQNAVFTLVPAESLGLVPKSENGTCQTLWFCSGFHTSTLSTPVRSIILRIGFLGRGSHGWVDKIKVLPHGQFYARKTLGLDGSSLLGSQVMSEIELLRSMDHPHIIHFVGAYSLGSSLSIIMEPVAEGDLKQVLETPERWPQAVKNIPSWFGCLASALSYLHEHKRVVHMDIKPANILIRSGNVVLTDFGLAYNVGKDIKWQDLSPLRQMTPMYAPPESREGTPPGPGFDAWSLGCTFVEMLTVSLGHTLYQLHTFIGLNPATNSSSKTYSSATDGLHKWLLVLKSEAESELIQRLLELVKSMLDIDYARRPSAASVNKEVHEILSRHNALAITQVKCDHCRLYLSETRKDVEHPAREVVNCGVSKQSDRSLTSLHSSNRGPPVHSHRHLHALLKVSPNHSRKIRLLKCSRAGEFTLTNFVGDDVPCYAILAHVWGANDEEVTYEDLTNGTGKDKPGYEKILFCGEQARRDGLQYIWVDTCCIDESNSTEVQEAIESMFRWYQKAAKCYVYRSDVSTAKRKAGHEFSGFTRKSVLWSNRWFKRRWMLQELLGPLNLARSQVEFFSREQQRLRDGIYLKQHIFVGYIHPVCDEEMRSAFKRLLDKVSKLKNNIQRLHLTNPDDDKKRRNDWRSRLLTWIKGDLGDDEKCRNDHQSRVLPCKGVSGASKAALGRNVFGELNNSMAETAVLSAFFFQGTDLRMNRVATQIRGLIYLSFTLTYMEWSRSRGQDALQRCYDRLIQDIHWHHADQSLNNSLINYCVSDLTETQHSKCLRYLVWKEMQGKANGMFLWVSVVIKELKDVMDLEVVQVLDEIPMGWKDACCTSETGPYNDNIQNFAAKALLTLVTAGHPLSVRELSTLGPVRRRPNTD